MKTITITLTLNESMYLTNVLEKASQQIKQGGDKGSFTSQGISVNYTVETIDCAKPEREVRKEMINGVINEFVKSKI
jgi:ABC-type arginine/histidine transport system permease subunit